MKKNVQGILWYDYVAVIRHHKQTIPAEAGPAVESGMSVVLLVDMRVQLSNV
jgi:hypothetical protein